MALPEHRTWLFALWLAMPKNDSIVCGLPPYPVYILITGDDRTPVSQINECVLRIRREVAASANTAEASNIEVAVYSVDLIDKAIAEAIDTILVHAMCSLTPGAIREMLAVSHLDPRIAFVMPHTRAGPLAQASRGVPRYTFVPFDLPAVLWIRGTILAEFAESLPIADAPLRGSPALMLRVNRCGYLLAVANHALVADVPPRPPLAEIAGRLALDFPEAPGILQRYLCSTEYRATRLFAELEPAPNNKRRVIFDLSLVTAHYNGTAEAARAIVSAAAASWPSDVELCVAISPAGWKRHGFCTIPNIRQIAIGDQVPCAAVVRIGQPYNRNDLRNAFGHSAVAAIFMFDAIAYDCGYLSVEFDAEVWKIACNVADLVICNSRYTLQCLRHRFAFGRDTATLVSHHSLDTSEYCGATATGSRDSILVLGNHYTHKFVAETVDAMLFAELPWRIVALGYPREIPVPENVLAHDSGDISAAELERIYGEARVAIFPSHYEGFGFPILNALARKLPIFVRDSELNRELAAYIPEARNIHYFSSVRDLAARVASPPSWTDDLISSVSAHNWATSAAEIWSALEAAMEGANTDRIAYRLQQSQAMFPPLAEYLPSLSPEQRAALRLAPLFRRLSRLPVFKQLLNIALKHWRATRSQ